jgi:cation transport ATPase
MQRMADVVAGYFVVTVVSIAVLTLFGWGLWGPEPSWVYGLINAVAVLIIACPCALGLATPMSIMVATGKAATQGILFRDAAAIENLRKVDTLIIDKTGTLTEGRPVFEKVLPCTGLKLTNCCDWRPAWTKAVSIPWLPPWWLPRVIENWCCPAARQTAAGRAIAKRGSHRRHGG